MEARNKDTEQAGDAFTGATTSAQSAAKFTLSFNGAGRKHASGPQQHSSAKRQRMSLLGEMEDDGDRPRHETISTFGNAFSVQEMKNGVKQDGERIIKSIPNKDWRVESQRKRESQPNGDSLGKGQQVTQADTGGIASRNRESDNLDGRGPKFGLNIVDKNKSDPDGPGGDIAASNHNVETPNSPHVDRTSQSPSGPPSADEEALAALLGHHDSKKNVIIAPARLSEDDVFRDSYTSAPRNCTLEEYEATPVEGYGAAILRGYLKEGQTLDDPSRNDAVEKGKAGFMPERRPGLLGLGAKESGLGVELGAWGKGAGRPRAHGSGAGDATYNPLARRNKKTGELVTEHELSERLKSQKNGGSDRETHASTRRGDAASRSSRPEDSKRLGITQGRYESMKQDSRESRREPNDDHHRRHSREKYGDVERGSAGRSGRKERELEDFDRRRRRDEARDLDEHSADRRRRPRDEYADRVDGDHPRHRERSRERAKRDHRSSQR